MKMRNLELYCNMFKRIWVLPLFLGVAYLSAQSGADFQKKKIDEVSISFPSSYEFSDNMPGGAKFGVLSPLENEKDTFRENVNMLIQDIGQDIDVAEGLEPMKQQMSKYITNYKEISATIEMLPVGKCIR